jgi:hypothetical protein
MLKRIGLAKHHILKYLRGTSKNIRPVFMVAARPDCSILGL